MTDNHLDNEHAQQPDDGHIDRSLDHADTKADGASGAPPLVHSQADLHDFWSFLMGELGFSYPRLYLTFVPPDGHVHGLAVEIAELPDVPEPEITAGLFEMCQQLIAAEFPEGTRPALLYAHPGRGGISAKDRTWGAALVKAARRQGLAIWPVHVANDHELRVLAPDDLAMPA